MPFFHREGPTFQRRCQGSSRGDCARDSARCCRIPLERNGWAQRDACFTKSSSWRGGHHLVVRLPELPDLKEGKS